MGETFTFYVCLQNDSDQPCADICIKADLQTTTQRIALPNRYPEPQHLLAPGAGLNTIVSHEVKDLGQHMFVI